MTKTLEFFFDVGSPTAYLAYCRLLQLREQYHMEIRMRPMLLGGVFKSTDNASPVTIPAKGRYMMEQDLPRFAQRYGVVLRPNPHFPVNTLELMRTAIAAARAGCLEPYLATVFPAMWVEGKDMADTDVVVSVLDEAGLDGQKLLEATRETEIKAELIANTEEAVSRGVFGAPTMFIGDQMYFGQDRLDFVEERLAN